MNAMIDLACKMCRRRVGFRHGQEPRCYHCGTLNDTSEVDGLLAEMRAYHLQRDVDKALPRERTKLAMIASEIGIDGELLIRFTRLAKPLPTAELGRVREWMARQA